MWYPAQQQQQYSCYGYAHQLTTQQQQQKQRQQKKLFLRTSDYCNGNELSTTNIAPINRENESPAQCQTTYSGNAPHVIADCYVTTLANLYGDEMLSFHTTPIRNPYWNPVLAAPKKLAVGSKTISTNVSSSSIVSSSSSSSSSSACWDWLLFSPDYYSELYTPLSTNTYHHQQKLEEENDDDININILASMPTCLLALLCLTPKLINTSDDENDNDQEISSLHVPDEPLLSSLLNNNNNNNNNIREKCNNISSNLSLSSDNKNSSNLNINKQDRSSTPDTDDGYQSASDVSRSDYSRQSSRRDEHQNSKDDITLIKHSSPTPLMPRRITYAAAVKPNTTSTNKISPSPMVITKPKQIFNNTQSTITNDILNMKGQKSKFIAPRFERMHHAKQNTTSSMSSNRTQICSANINQNTNQRNHINSYRRR